MDVSDHVMTDSYTYVEMFKYRMYVLYSVLYVPVCMYNTYVSVLFIGQLIVENTSTGRGSEIRNIVIGPRAECIGCLVVVGGLVVDIYFKNFSPFLFSHKLLLLLL